MAKVAMMESGLRRKQTYEEIIDYIENDPDKVQYPNRAAKFLRNTFQLSQLDGMGQALLEQQEINEMAERVKYYQLKELADQNETSKKIEDAKNTSPPAIEGGPASSSGGGGGPGIVGSVVGGVITAAPYVASGVGSVLRGAVNAASFAGSMLPTSLDEDAEQHENDTINDHAEQQSRRKQRERGYMRDVHDHLDEVRQQQERHLPVLPAFPIQSSPAPSSSYSSVAAPSSPAPTQFYIGDSEPATPARTIKSSPLSIRSSPNTIKSSPQVIQSSPEAIRSSSSIEGPFGARARTEGELRDERRRKKFGY